MAEYIEREPLIKGVRLLPRLAPYNSVLYSSVQRAIFNAPTADVVEVKHGEWILEVRSFYADNFSEDIELSVYILSKCSNCGEKHKPHQVFSKRLYAPEDADDDFRFDQEYEKLKAVEEFKQKGYKFQNYCPNCGAKMDLKEGAEE